MSLGGGQLWIVWELTHMVDMFYGKKIDDMWRMAETVITNTTVIQNTSSHNDISLLTE